MYYRIIYRIMKVTALIPDDLIQELRRHSTGKNLTETLIIALDEWLSLKKIKKLNKLIEKSPLRFRKGYTPEKTRNLNRTR